MPQYLVHISLHHAHPGDYHTLYEQMEAKGFNRTIENSKSKKEYHLLHAEYIITVASKPAPTGSSVQEATAKHVYELVDQALTATIAASKKAGRTSYLTTSYTMVEYVGTLWYSKLDEVKKN